MSGLRKQSAISVSSLTSNSSRPQAFIAPEPASITSVSQNECSIPEEKEETGAQVAKISLVGASLTNAGLVLGLGNPTARSNDQTNRGDSERRGDHEYEFSTSTSLLVSVLGQKKYRNFSQITEHARTTSTSEQCFFCLLLLVTFIYAIAILTALMLLCFMLWLYRI